MRRRRKMLRARVILLFLNKFNRKVKKVFKQTLMKPVKGIYRDT